LTNTAEKGRDFRLPNGVFICYAWPDLKKEKHLEWLQPFLKGLRQHLHQAGLALVKLDIVDNPPGGSIEEYMRSAQTSDFVILIGTESLLFKHEGSGISAVCTELVYIRRKREADHKAGKHRVFPLLVSGIYPKAFPAEYDRYNTVKDWKEGPKTYFEHLCWLIAALYSTENEAFQEIWDKFLGSLGSDEKALVTGGLTQKGVEDRQLEEKNKKQADEEARDRAGRALLDLGAGSASGAAGAVPPTAGATQSVAKLGKGAGFFASADESKSTDSSSAVVGQLKAVASDVASAGSAAGSRPSAVEKDGSGTPGFG